MAGTRRDVRAHARWLAAAALIATSTAVEMPRAQAPAPAQAPLAGAELVRATYTKYEYLVPMRDGARLFTAVYVPKDTSQLSVPADAHALQRGAVRRRQHPARSARRSSSRRRASSSSTRTRAGATCRRASSSRCARSMPDKRGPKDVDESTDTYDTIEWLLEERAEPQRARRDDRHLAARLPRRGEHHRRASRRSRPRRRRRRRPTTTWATTCITTARSCWRPTSASTRDFTPRGDDAGAAAARRSAFDSGTPDGYEFFLQRSVPLADASTRELLRRQGGVLAGDRRPPDLRRVLEAALALEVHDDGVTLRGAQRRRLVRRRGSGRAAAHLSRDREEEPERRRTCS